MVDRIVYLEEKIAFQENTLQMLDEVVTRQQAQIDQMRKEIETLRERMQAMTPSNIAPMSEETPPPHY